jgi:hypothetical protein
MKLDIQTTEHLRANKFGLEKTILIAFIPGAEDDPRLGGADLAEQHRAVSDEQHRRATNEAGHPVRIAQAAEAALRSKRTELYAQLEQVAGPLVQQLAINAEALHGRAG